MRAPRAESHYLGPSKPNERSSSSSTKQYYQSTAPMKGVYVDHSLPLGHTGLFTQNHRRWCHEAWECSEHGWMILLSNVLLSVTQSVGLLKEQNSFCYRPLVPIKNNAGFTSSILYAWRQQAVFVSSCGAVLGCWWSDDIICKPVLVWGAVWHKSQIFFFFVEKSSQNRRNDPTWCSCFLIYMETKHLFCRCFSRKFPFDSKWCGVNQPYL